MSETDLRESVCSFYETQYVDEIQTLTDRFPEDHSLRLDYRDLRAFDADLAEVFRTSPGGPVRLLTKSSKRQNRD